MARAIASKELVVRLGRAGMMGFLGTAGLAPGEIRDSLRFIQSELAHGEAYGMNLICNLERPETELDMVSICLSRFTRVELGLHGDNARTGLVPARRTQAGRPGKIVRDPQVMAKLSLTEVAETFYESGSRADCFSIAGKQVGYAEQADLAREVPMSFDIYVEADLGGHTDRGIATVLLRRCRACAANCRGNSVSSATYA